MRLIFIVYQLVLSVYSQKNWRHVYLEDPKGILTSFRRTFDSTAEFTDLGSSYERGSIWPKPQSEERSEGTAYSFSPKDFKFEVEESPGDDEIVRNALTRYEELTFPNKELKANPELEKIKSLKITVKDYDEPLSLKSDESYTLTVKAPQATLTANSTWGALRGLETFSQVVFQKDRFYQADENTINDRPRFHYRGFLIDTSRHFLPVTKIYQILDALAYSKMNVLHWHIVDDPSFPYESKKFPQLHTSGAFDKNHVYKPEDVKNIITYAKLRGIRVMPEFDTPGHTHSWKGIPHLLTECGSTNQPEGMFQDMKGPINPIKESTYTFLKDFFKEVTEVFPDEYIHLGGDEVDFQCWLSNDDIKEWLKKQGDGANGTTIHSYFMKKLIKIIEGLKKHYVVWQEVFDDQVKISPKTVVNVWKEDWKQEMARVTKSGHKAILSSPWYVNYIKYGLDWPKLYKSDPEDFDGTDEQKKLVMGGSAAIWGEYVDATNVLQRSFGRTFAVAERLWSPREQHISSDVMKDALKRIWEHRCRYIDRGLPVEPVTRSKFCRHEWNGV